MAYYNLFLTTGQTLSKEDVVRCGSRVSNRFPQKWTDGSMITLENLLCNLVRYHNQPILYQQRASKNEIPRYNPLGVGQKKLIDYDSGVLWKLIDSNLVNQKMGVNPYFAKKGDDKKTSEMKSTERVIAFAKCLGITKDKIKELPGSHIVLKKPNKSPTTVNFKETKLTQHMEDLMIEYNNFLQSYSITCEGESFKDFKLRRTFRDEDGDASMKYGGRTGGAYHQIERTKRIKHLRINRSKTASIDLVSSQMNFLYAYKTKGQLNEIDRYHLEDFSGSTNRKFSKGMHSMMLNNENSSKASGAFEHKWLGRTENRYLKQVFKYNPFDLYELQRKIRKAHQSLGNVWYQPKIGMNIQFLESSFIFEVAIQCCRQGVPALTLHDEIIVPQADKEIVEMIMKGTPLNKQLYKAIF